MTASTPAAVATDLSSHVPASWDGLTRSSDTPIRLLKFLAYLAIGGTERQVLNLKSGLDPARFSVHVGCFGQFTDELAVELGRGTPLQIYRIKKLYGVRAMKEAWRLARYLRRQRMDIVHAYNFYANVFAVPAARAARVPVVLASIRDTGEYWTPKQRRVNKLVCRLADRVVVNAEAIKAALIAEGYAADHVHVIPNGILCPALRPPAAGRAVRQRLNVPPDVPLVGVVARIARLKGLEYFVEAARAALERFPEARFLLVGDTRVDAAYREELKAQCRRLGVQDRVIFTGFRSDVHDILSALTVSVLPSISGEGLSNSVLESMAAAVPVVATRVGGNPEVVVDGETGFLVPPKDPLALAQAIGRILAAPGLGGALGQAGRRRVLEQFSNARMIERTQRLYEALLEQSVRGRGAASR